MVGCSVSSEDLAISASQLCSYRHSLLGGSGNPNRGPHDCAAISTAPNTIITKYRQHLCFTHFPGLLQASTEKLLAQADTRKGDLYPGWSVLSVFLYSSTEAPEWRFSPVSLCQWVVCSLKIRSVSQLNLKTSTPPNEWFIKNRNSTSLYQGVNGSVC